MAHQPIARPVPPNIRSFDPEDLILAGVLVKQMLVNALGYEHNDKLPRAFGAALAAMQEVSCQQWPEVFEFQKSFLEEIGRREVV